MKTSDHDKSKSRTVSPPCTYPEIVPLSALIACNAMN